MEESTIKESIATETEVEVFEEEEIIDTSQISESIEEELIEDYIEDLDAEVDTLVEEMTEEMASEFIEEEVEKIVTLQPVKTLTAIGKPTERRVASMNVVTKTVLSPEVVKDDITVLSPVKRMTPLKLPPKKMQPEE